MRELLAQQQQQQQLGRGGLAGHGSGAQTSEDEEERKRQMEEARQHMLRQILEPEARERCEWLSLVLYERRDRLVG